MGKVSLGEDQKAMETDLSESVQELNDFRLLPEYIGQSPKPSTHG